MRPVKSVAPSLRTVAREGFQLAWRPGVSQRSVRVRVTGESAAAAGIGEANRLAQTATSGASARAILMTPSTHGNGDRVSAVTQPYRDSGGAHRQGTVIPLFL